MTKWKKAISTLAAASLLASLLSTAFVGTTFAANGPYGTAFPYTTDVTEQPANGTSYITLSFGTPTVSDATVINITVTGATFINGEGDFVPANFSYPRTGVLKAGTSVSIGTGSKLWMASSTAGTATVAVQYVHPVASVPTTVPDSNQSFTFTAASTNVPSTALSTTGIRLAGVDTASPASYPKAAAVTTLTMHTVVKDNNGNFIAAGVTVEWTISGPAYFNPATTTGVGSATASATASGTTGVADSPFIVSTGSGGTATITTTVKYLGVSYALANKVVNFVGDPATITASNGYFSIATGTSQPALLDANGNAVPIAGDGAIEVVLQDANKFDISTGATFQIVSPTPAAYWTVVGQAWDSDENMWDLRVTCGSVAGTASANIKATVGTKTVTTTTPVSLTCATKLTTIDLGTLSVDVASGTVVAPNGQLGINATVKDKNGLPAPDGTLVTAATNGVGNIVVVKSNADQKGTVNGVAKFLFLAPPTSGTAVVTFFGGGNTTPNNISVTLTIGAGLTAGGTNGSQLGLSHSGSFTSATKIQTRNHYVTWKLHFSAAAAGQSAGIWIATKNSAGVWSSFHKLTGRIIDSSGNAYFSWRSSTAKWISIKGIAGSVGTPARQARWK